MKIIRAVSIGFLVLGLALASIGRGSESEASLDTSLPQSNVTEDLGPTLDSEIQKVYAQHASSVAIYHAAVEAQLAEEARLAAEAEAARAAEARKKAAARAAAQPRPAVTGDVWSRLAQCESGMTNANTGNGYYGYFQFSATTWRSVGGSGLPTDHDYATQLHFAQILQQRSGWGQWPACSAKLGLR